MIPDDLSSVISNPVLIFVNFPYSKREREGPRLVSSPLQPIQFDISLSHCFEGKRRGKKKSLP